jgi:hypothetical protein
MKAITLNMQYPANVITTLTIVMKTTHRSTTIQIKPSNSQQQQEYGGTETTKITDTNTKVELRLTSQQPESAQYPAQRLPEHNTGNDDSTHARPSEERGTADQSTSELKL